MPFLLRLDVQDSDTDELGHANNVSYVRWINEVALQHSAAVGWPPAAYLDRGQTFVVRRHEIDYLRSALPRDPIEIETRVVSLRAASSVRETVIRDGRTAATLVRAVTHWAFIDLRTSRPVRIPVEIRDSFPVESPSETRG